MVKVTELSVDEAWLLAVSEGPIRRDSNPNAIPFDVANRLMEKRYIEPGVETFRGPVATQRWRVWQITKIGRGHLKRTGVI